jgi:pyruvate-ferredoxin/flavodoxin oxidoreductase
MEQGMLQQKRAVASGHWPLIRYNPMIRDTGGVPFTLDSLRPTLPLVEYRKHEGRYKLLARENPEEAERLAEIAQQTVHLRWDVYEKMAGRRAEQFPADGRRD